MVRYSKVTQATATDDMLETKKKIFHYVIWWEEKKIRMLYTCGSMSIYICVGERERQTKSAEKGIFWEKYRKKHRQVTSKKRFWASIYSFYHQYNLTHAYWYLFKFVARRGIRFYEKIMTVHCVIQTRHNITREKILLLGLKRNVDFDMKLFEISSFHSNVHIPNILTPRHK